MSEPIDLSDLAKRLDIIVQLLALRVTSDMDSLKDKAIMLERAGLTPKAIAGLFDTSPNTVSVALSSARRARGRSRVQRQRR